MSGASRILGSRRVFGPLARAERARRAWVGPAAIALAFLLAPPVGFASGHSTQRPTDRPRAGSPLPSIPSAGPVVGRAAGPGAANVGARLAVSQGPADRVNRTTVLFNDTVLPGGAVASPIEYPNALALDPATGSIWVGSYGIGQVPQNPLGRVNLTTDQVDFSNATAGGTAGFYNLVYDPANDVLFGGIDGGNVGVWNATTGQFRTMTSVTAQPSMVLDPATDQVYVIGNANVTVLNATTDKLAATVLVHNTPVSVAYDPAARAVAATNDGLYLSGTSYVSFINDTTYSWFDTNIPNNAGGYNADPTSIAYDPANDTVVVPCSRTASFEIFNATSGALVRAVSDGSDPTVLQFDPLDDGFFASSGGGLQILRANFSVARDLNVAATGSVELDATTDQLYVTDLEAWAGGGLDEFNATSGALEGIVNLSAAAPRGLAYTPDGSELFVAGYGGRAVWVVNATSSRVQGSMASPATGGPWDVLPDGRQSAMYVSETNSGRIEAWNATPPFAIRNQTWVNPSDPNLPFAEGMALDAHHGRLLVADSGEGNVTLLNLTRPVDQQQVAVGSQPTDVVDLAATDEYAVVDSGSDQLVLVNATSLKPVGSATVGLSPTEACFDPLIGSVVVTNTGSHTLSAVSVAGLSTRTVAVGDAPAGILFDPSSGELLVADSGSANLTVLNASTLSVVGSLDVGDQPEGLAIDPTGPEVAVSEYGSDAIAFVTVPPTQVGSGLGVDTTATPSTGAAPLNVTFVTWAHGGTPPYQYAYEFGDGSSYRANGSGNVTHLFATAGKFFPELWVNDSGGQQVTVNFTITPVVEALSATSAEAFPASADVNQSATFNVTATGGTGVYTYEWFGLPPGCSAQNSSRIICPRLLSPASTQVIVGVFDSAGAGVEPPSTGYQVDPDTSLSAMSATPSVVDPNQTTTIVASFTGGRSPFAYLWSGLPAGCASADAAEISCAPSQPGTFSVTVNVTDANGFPLNGSNTTLLVAPALRISTISGAPRTLDVGDPLTLSTSASGGSGGFSFRWSSLPTGCSSASTTTLTCIPSEGGTFAVSVQVTDGAGDTVTSPTATVTVDPDPTVRLGLASGEPSTFEAGTSIQFVAVVLNGSAPYRFGFSGLPSGCEASTGARLNCTPDVPGTFTETVTVTDASGRSATASFGVNVTSPAPSSGPAGPTPTLLYGALAIVAALAVGGGLIVWRSRRRTSELPPADDPPP